MAKAHLEVSDADELMIAIAPLIAVKMVQARRDLQNDLEVYNRRYPVLTMLIRLLIAAIVVVSVVWITEYIIATLTHDNSLGIQSLVWLVVWGVILIAAQLLGIIRNQLPSRRGRRRS